MTKAAMTASVEPKAPIEMPLACKLRTREVMGRDGPIPNMGEVELENCSDIPIEIEYTMTPLQFLELEVLEPSGKVISEGHFSDRFSPRLEPAVLRLKPGEKFTANVSLLATLPLEKRAAGRYTIQASYRFQGKKVMAEPVMLEVPEGRAAV